MESKLLAATINPHVTFNGIGPLGNPGTLGGAPFALERVVSVTLAVITIFAGLYFIFQVFIGTFNWISAGSDKNALERAQKRITNAVVGLFLVIFAYGFVALISLIFGLDILKTGIALNALRP